jgi:hypothetical protein
MGISGGPDMIQDGLVVSLDAADRNSYTSGSNTWYDLSGNNNHFVGSGNYGFSNNAIIFNRNNTTNTGTIFTLSNIPDQLKIENFLGNNFTIETWILPQTISGSNTDATEPAQGVILWPGFHNGQTIDPTGLNFSTIWNSGQNNAFNMIASSSFLSTQKYQQIVTTINYGSTISNGYVNGSLAFTTGSKPPSVMTSAGGNPANTINIGAARTSSNYKWFYTGSMAIIKLYNRALSAQEVLQNYNAQKSRFGL